MLVIVTMASKKNLLSMCMNEDDVKIYDQAEEKKRRRSIKNSQTPDATTFLLKLN